MMEISDVISAVADHDRGRWFDILDPVTGEATGMRMRIAGPDSEAQRRARLAMTDELTDAADDEGRVSAEAREKAHLGTLARCILDWDVTDGGEAVPLTHQTAVRLLKAGTWLAAQVDAYAGDRAVYREGAT